MLLAELLRKFPPPIPPMMNQQQLPAENNANEATNNASEASPAGNQAQNTTNITEIKTEPLDLPPPEKKPKI